MNWLAKLSPDGLSAAYATLDEFRADFPLRMFPARPTAAQLEGTGYVNVEPVEQPTIGFGEGAILASAPEKVGPAWRQVWGVQSITLVQAKQQLAQMAASIYVEKVTAPTPQQLLQSGYTGAIQARSTYFKPKFDDVAARVQAAATIEQAYAIYQELEVFS